MLSEEEKKAIERLEEQLNFWKKQNIKNSDCEIILSFITKLQKENKEKDKIIKKQENKIYKLENDCIVLHQLIDEENVEVVKWYYKIVK